MREMRITMESVGAAAEFHGFGLIDPSTKTPVAYTIRASRPGCEAAAAMWNPKWREEGFRVAPVKAVEIG